MLQIFHILTIIILYVLFISVFLSLIWVVLLGGIVIRQLYFLQILFFIIYPYEFDWVRTFHCKKTYFIPALAENYSLIWEFLEQAPAIFSREASHFLQHQNHVSAPIPPHLSQHPALSSHDICSPRISEIIFPFDSVCSVTVFH